MVCYPSWHVEAPLPKVGPGGSIVGDSFRSCTHSSSGEEKCSDGQDSPPLDEKDGKHLRAPSEPGQWIPSTNWIQRFLVDYTGEHAGETLPAGTDPERCAYSVLTMDETAAVDHLKYVIVEHADDYTFDTAFMARIKELILGNTHCGMECEDGNIRLPRSLDWSTIGHLMLKSARSQYHTTIWMLRARRFGPTSWPRFVFVSVQPSIPVSDNFFIFVHEHGDI